MKSTEFYALAEQFAPKSLSDEFCRRYGAYDNSGLLLDSGEEAEKILFSLDLSLAAIERAKREGAGIICTHHPAVYAKLGRLLSSEPASSGGKVAACLKAGISVVSMHLNLDAAPCGIDESLMEGIILSAKSAKEKADGGGENGKIPFGERAASESEERFRQEGAQPENVGIMQPLDGGGYGRAYDVPPVTAEALAAETEKTFCAKHIAVYGKRKEIRRAASFCGAGADEEAVEFAVRQGADVLVSSDFKHHVLTLALESGLSVIQLTHYASENYGFEKYYRKIRRQAGIPCIFHTDEELL